MRAITQRLFALFAVAVRTSPTYIFCIFPKIRGRYRLDKGRDLGSHLVAGTEAGKAGTKHKGDTNTNTHTFEGLSGRGIAVIRREHKKLP